MGWRAATLVVLALAFLCVCVTARQLENQEQPPPDQKTHLSVEERWAYVSYVANDGYAIGGRVLGASLRVCSFVTCITSCLH